MSKRNHYDPAQERRRHIAQLKDKARRRERDAQRQGVDVIPHLNAYIEALELALQRDT